MMSVIAPLLLVAAAAQAGDVPPDAAQSDLAPQTADPCDIDGACRTIDQLRFEGPDGTVTEVQAGMTLPFVSQGNVLITPGESITIALLEDSDLLIPLLVGTGDTSRDADLPLDHIRFTMTDVIGGQVRLSVESTFPDMLDYAALMVTIGKGPERTDVCSLMQGVTVFEQWQAPIYQMALWGFRKSDDYGCKTIDLEAEPTQRDAA